jgi:hypothetical protein
MTMYGIEPDNRPRRRFGKPQALGLLAAGAIAGGILAATLTATAQSGTATTTAATTTASAPAGAPAGAPSGAPQRGHGGAAPVRSDEKALSSADAAKVKAAALKAVPGGTVYRVETDAGDGAYEAHMTKADGTEVTVKFDKSFAVTKVESGMGTGDPAPAGQPGMAH